MNKRTRDDSAGRRRDLIPAADARRVRRVLGMTQAEFAAALGVSRRTIIRGEARGFEVPMRSDTRRPWVWAAWGRLQTKAAKLSERSK